MTKTTTYQITTVHPTGYMNGLHTVNVSVNSDGSRYVKGKGFGCSRDYQTKSDTVAIGNLMAENGMRLLSCQKVK